MSVPSKFLTLSIKEQLWITILILTLFSALVILCLPGSFSYEILMEDYKRKKKFFYNEYMEYIQASFYFHSFNILKYEEIIKRMAKQIYKYNTKENIFNYNSVFENNDNLVQDLFNDNKNEDNILYEYCYSNSAEICYKFKEKLNEKYESINGLIFSHDILDRFKLPDFDIPIINSFFGVNVNDSVIFGFNKTGLYKAFMNTRDINNINRATLDKYYKSSVSRQMEFTENNILSYLNLDLFLFNKLFKKVVDEMNTMEERTIFYTNISYAKAFDIYSKAALGHYSQIELSNDKCYVVSHVKEEDKYYYFQFNLIENYLDLIGQLLSNDQNMDFIPFFPLNHTILSPGLCTNFLMKQSTELFNEKILNDTLNKIKKGKSGIDACFYEKQILENKLVKEMLETNITHFLVSGNKMYQGIIKLNEPYFFIKGSFPNLNILKEYQSDYLLIDQIDFYFFANFKEPIEYSEHIKKQYQNLFYLIVMLIIYIWIICFIVNMIIYCKISKQITEPIHKLQDAIENSNLKDESVFKYEYDDIINELFITCKELLTGQIDTNNSLKYSGKFNILNKQNDKDIKIDKNKYQKNLIINNGIINDLINEQQNMMNFKKEIDINDESIINEDICENEEVVDYHHKKLKKSKSKTIENNNNTINEENQDNNDSIKQNKNQEEDEKDKKSYKSMFRLAQYLYYYRCKVEEKNISINNSNIDDKKSSISKISKLNNNQNPNSIRANQKHKKSLQKSGNYDKNEENIAINVLNGKDITYLWYMEMKQKKNKSFNYELSDDLEELFID